MEHKRSDSKVFKLYLAYKAVQAVSAATSAVITVAPYVAGGIMTVQAGAYVAPKLVKLASENLHEPNYVKFPEPAARTW